MSIRSIIAGLFNFSKNRVQTAIDEHKTWARPTESDFVDMPEDQLRYMHDSAKCPYCKSEHGLYEGPRGGASINVLCGNPDCNSRFNVVDPEFGFIPIGQFTGECPPEFIARRRVALEKSDD